MTFFFLLRDFYWPTKIHSGSERHHCQVYLNFSATLPEILDGKAWVHSHEVDAKGFEITCMSYKMYLSTVYTSMCVCAYTYYIYNSISVQIYILFIFGYILYKQSLWSR